jgi:SAM-dependent methyltransferase
MSQQRIKEKVKERYGRIALTGSSDCCGCAPGQCSSPTSPPDAAAVAIGYDEKELVQIPKESMIGAGCGAPVNFADLKEGEAVVDLGSGAGIDVFVAANRVGKAGRAIGVDMTDEMLARARANAAKGGYGSNVEFRKGDVEERIPLESDSADVVISNCVINLTTDKGAAFSEIYRVLRKGGGGRMVTSDLVADRERAGQGVDDGRRCSCIDGALSKEGYLSAIRAAGFRSVSVLEERPYMEGEGAGGRRITASW